MTEQSLLGLRSYHWAAIVVLAVLQVIPASSAAETQGTLAGRLVFAFLFSTVIVFLLTKLYRYVRSR